MLALLVAGVLDKAPTFPSDDVSADLIRSSFKPNDQNLCDFVELVEPLKEIGRDDLAQAIERKIAIYLDREPGLKGWAKRFDRNYLNSNLTRFSRAIQKKKLATINCGYTVRLTISRCFCEDPILITHPLYKFQKQYRGVV